MDLQAPSSNNGEEEAANFCCSETSQNLLAFEDFDSNCSTPYVSAPSSPGRGSPFGGGGGGGYYYSAPASPMHFVLTSGAAKLLSAPSSPPENRSVAVSSSSSFEFELFGHAGSGQAGWMSSADELFLNGKIRPMKLSTHLERPQVLVPLPDMDTEDEEDPNISDFGGLDGGRGRDLRLRDKSLRRRTRSMSPLRSLPFEWSVDNNKNHPLQGVIDQEQDDMAKIEALSAEASANGTSSASASSSRSSSAGRSSKRWVFLKDFLRSKSEGRSNNKFWATISFSPAVKEKPARPSTSTISASAAATTAKEKQGTTPDPDKPKRKNAAGKKKAGKPINGAAKRRVPPSPHELHYTANRAQAEEMRKRTFLPYRQGLLSCLGFSSKGYRAMNGFARALNPVSSR
ncbi:hypothetical protein SAY87_003526 [Trapa incisa]|uniref:Calmodulin-binding protein n=1 Tax=Trapa incisa TaxID=236973 RepID=A0AAN7KRI8_9MYRT|nr:hypothetical protein SAY87_003526 [Trapa incisa]